MYHKGWISILRAVLPCRFVLQVAFACFGLVSSFVAVQAETRSLKLYYVHTRERAEIIFKKDGRYVQSGLKRLNYFLRDWRRNEPARMDPLLFDLVWQIYRLSGSREYIRVVSAYRSPQTNNMLRARSVNSGVAKHSQHTLGKAMDFYLPDVSLARLRRIGLKQQAGGIGYYPTSGSPFIHVDVGGVRHWPRMNRGELMALFPDGRTMHVPSDGIPLAGYAEAVADYKARHGQPPQIMVAAAQPQRQGSVLAALFSRNKPVSPAGKTMPDVASAVSGMLSSVTLPEENVPVPVFSPLRGLEHDEEEDNWLMAGLPGERTGVPAYIPVPDRKPVNGMARQAPMVVAAVETLPVKNIPVPVFRQRMLPADTAADRNEDSIMQAIQQSDAAVMAFTAEKSRQPEPEGDAVHDLIRQAELIPLPEEDFMSGEDAVALQMAARQESGPDRRQPVNQKAGVVIDNRTTPRTHRIAHRQTGNTLLEAEKYLTGQEKVAGQNGIASLAAVAQQLPKEVFVGGLQSRGGRRTSPHLSGTAINFRAIERISGMDEK